MKTNLKGILMAGLIGTAGCAKSCDRYEANGSYFGSTKAPYIVINYSGNKIMDVFKLESAIVQSEEHSDGWLFLDQQGRPVHLGGDVKTIRMKDSLINGHDKLFDEYCEYHAEFAGGKEYYEVCPPK